MKKYVTNDCGVVENPCIIWECNPKGALAWVRYNIKIGICDNGLWDYGYWQMGGASPCSVGKYSTKEIAIQKAITYFDAYFKKPYDGLISNPKYFLEGKKSFLFFKNQKFFENKKFIKNDYVTKKDDCYVQGSLF